MSDAFWAPLSRRQFLAVTGTASLLDRTAVARAWPLVSPATPSSSVPPSVVRGPARFQVLSPMLIRLEYAPDQTFIDVPSVAVINRHWPACPYTVHDAKGWVDIATDRMRIRYRLDSGPFTAENLVVTWDDPAVTHTWKPGDVDDQNLGGVPQAADYDRTLPGVAGGLSRNGYYRLDDSRTAVWNATTQWPEARPHRDNGQDWYFLVYGRDYKAGLHTLMQLLGPIPLVPRYIFGAWWTDRAGYNAAERERIVYRFREEGIPLDVVVMDNDSTAAIQWSGFSWDPGQFPDPRGFFAWMRARGVKVSINQHYGPITRDSDRHFDQVRQALGLPATTTEIPIDLTNPHFAQLFMDVLLKPALEMGMAFWWQDGAPASNIPGLDATLWLRYLEYAGQERITRQRTFAFCRLGEYADPHRPAWGVHRYGGYFSGDILTGWSTLAMQVPFNVQAGNILVPYVTHDLPAGGIDPSLTSEFYQRGVQLGAFSPIFRWHSSWGLRLPWEYGEAGMASVKQYLTLRYQLIPYIYTYARLAHETGTPLVRGTYLEYPEQEPAYTHPQQYLFGEAFVVAPITTPGNGQPVRTTVYLPAGEQWFDYCTGEIIAGGQVLACDCPVARIPVFVKAGAIIPLAPPMDYTDQRPLDPLILAVYAGKAATFRLYEDDGHSLDYRHGEYAWTPLRYTLTAVLGEHVLTIGPTAGQYQGQPQTRGYRVRVHGLVRPERVRVQGHLLPELRADDPGEGWQWHVAEHVTEITLSTRRSIRDQVTVRVEGAGTFADAVALQTIRAYRARVRQIWVTQQLRWSALMLDTTSQDIAVEPHVLLVTEGVEQTLNDLVDHPRGVAAHPVDFRALTAAILTACVQHPFRSVRTVPDREPNRQATPQQLAPAVFPPEDLSQMTNTLLACRLEATTAGSVRIDKVSIRTFVQVRFYYDTTCIAPPRVEYALHFPDVAFPGWEEIDRTVQPDGSLTIALIAPAPPVPGPHRLSVTATATWDVIQTVVTSDVVWTVPATDG